MEYSIKSTSDYPPREIAVLLTRSFEGYFVPIRFDEPGLLQMVRRDGVDLTSGRVVLADETPVGIALIARRGWTSRVAGMGITADFRGRGAGKFLMGRLVQEAHQRGDRTLTLEVIEQNEPAVRLYESFGFARMRRLAGFILEDPGVTGDAQLEEIDIRELARMIALYGFSDLPWQVSAETIAHFTPPARAFRSGAAYALISNPDVEHISFHSLLVEKSARGQGKAGEMIRAILAAHPGRTWHVPAIIPEEIGMVFKKVGFNREMLSQWQMKLGL